MKILYVSGYTRMVLFNKLLPKALRKNGFDVTEFDWNSVKKFNRIFNLIPREKIENEINSKLIKTAQKTKPHFVFILKGEPLSVETLDILRNEIGAVTFNWFGDDPWEFPTFSGKVANHYDFFFTYDPYSVKLYNKIGQKNAFHLPYGYDEHLVDSIELSEKEKKKYECDIAFIGSHYPKREELLVQLKDKYKLKIWGRGWKGTSCEDLYQGSALYGTDMLKAMKSVKILLNIHKGFEEGIEESGEGLNLRVMEAVASKSFQLTNNQADIKNRFVPNKEIAVFNSWNECLDKIEYFLDDDKKRKTIAEAGYNRFLKDHTLDKRMKEMMNIIQVHKTK